MLFMSQYEILHVFQHMTKIHSIIFILNVVYIYYSVGYITFEEFITM